MVPSIEAEAIRGWNSVKDTQQEGVLNDIEALTVIAAGGDVTYDEATTTMYMQKGDQWYSYEDPNSIVKKIDSIKDQGILGAMLWMVDNDAFFDGNPIINAIYNNLYTSSHAGNVSRMRAVLIPSLIGGLVIVLVILAVAMYFVYRKRHPEIPVTKRHKTLKRTTNM